MNSLWRKFAATTSVVILACGAAACGDKEDAASGASDAGADLKSDVVAASDLTQESFFTRVTAAQQKAKSSRVTMDVSVAGQSITATADVLAGTNIDDTAMAMTMDMGASGLGSVEMRLVDGVFYLNFGQLTGNKFTRMDMGDGSNPFGEQFGSLADQMDPAKALDQFESALTSFEKAGDAETIDGVKAQPYELVLDGSKLSDLAGVDSAAGMPETITYTMFIGPDDLPRRITADIAGTMLTMDYTRWGEPIDVKAPSASEISELDLGSLMSGAGA